MPPQPGEHAPTFALPDQAGRSVSLDDLAGHPVLVYFYPKADTPGCTAQACGLRDALPDLGPVRVVGISPDPPERQAKFDQKYSLGFPLLSDADHAVAEAYGAWGERSLYGKKYMGVIRSAFLIDEEGRIERAWPKITPKDTPVQLARALADRS